MSNPPGNHGRLAGVQLQRAPLCMIERMPPELKPNFILVAAAMKASLFLFEVVNVNSELLAVIEHRRLGAAFSCHARKIVEPADLLDRATASGYREAGLDERMADALLGGRGEPRAMIAEVVEVGAVEHDREPAPARLGGADDEQVVLAEVAAVDRVLRVAGDRELVGVDARRA